MNVSEEDVLIPTEGEHEGEILIPSHLREKILYHADEEWRGKGVKCKFLSAQGGGWKEGKVRVTFEFVPDNAQEEAKFLIS